ncbi:MAG: alkene reductase [Nannocystaceae bacterium]|nr:alkene reductase [Nannocystaceae bacterium]
MTSLFDPLALGPYSLSNRVFLAPMTRGRATADAVPTPRMAKYYAQRASGGLLISEGVQVSPQGVGWQCAPGIWTDEMVEAWKPVPEAVHAAGGRIFMQLWHLGRVSHPDFQNGAAPVGPSAIAAAGESHTPGGKKSYVTPRALKADELPGIVQDFVRGAKNAIAAGFDGIELHAANGYLLDQFIRDGANKRDDDYGGSIENRWRFPLEVAAAVAAAIGAERTGIRVSPTGRYNDMGDADPVGSYTYGAQQLSKLGVVYLHAVEPVPGHMMHNPDGPAVLPALREHFSGIVVTNGGFEAESAAAVLKEGLADAVAFGMPFLANPDLVQRLKTGAEQNAPDFATFYSDTDKGYADYPALA